LRLDETNDAIMMTIARESHDLSSRGTDAQRRVDALELGKSGYISSSMYIIFHLRGISIDLYKSHRQVHLESHISRFKTMPGPDPRTDLFEEAVS